MQAGRLLPSYGSNSQLPQIWQFMGDVEFHTETRAQGGNEGMEGVFKLPHNMKRLRIATTGHGAASWQIFCAELAILRSVCKACFQNHLPANWSLVEDVPSKALVAKNLTQRGGEMLILNSSAGPAAAAEKTPPTRTVIHKLASNLHN